MAEKNKETKLEESVKTEETKVEDKKEEPVTKTEKSQKKEKTKKNEAVVNGTSLPISAIDAMFICRFIKKKNIPKAIADLEEVLKFKRAIPMTGEVPHRKGKIMSGRYPIKPVGQFIKLLKNLQANANVNGLNEPVIVEAIANKAYEPFGRFGAIRRKRTHVKIKVMEKKVSKKEKKQK